MYILATILKNGHHRDKKNLRIFNWLCVIFGTENVYLDTNIFFLNQLETEILKHLNSITAILKKTWLPRWSDFKFAYL